MHTASVYAALKKRKIRKNMVTIECDIGIIYTGKTKF